MYFITVLQTSDGEILLIPLISDVFMYHNVCFYRKYDQALEYHRQALVLIPQHASTYAAIGYVHSLMGDFESAIDYFHTVWCLYFQCEKKQVPSF